MPDETGSARAKTRDEIAEAYRSEPWWYDVRGFFVLISAYNTTLADQMRLFGPNFGARHLEVACGTGTLLQMMLNWRRRRRLPAGRVVGVDYASPMLAGARHRFAARPEFEFVHADAASLPFDANAFDTINIANAVHCFPDVDGALRDVFRVLAPGGTLAANVLLYPRGPWPLKALSQWVNDWGIRKGILYTPYQPEDIRRRCVEAGFQVKAERVKGNCSNLLLTKPLPPA